MTVFLSTMVYALGRQLGMAGALAEVGRQLENASDKTNLPVVRVINRFRLLTDVELHLDTGATCIGKARSRAFHEAWESGFESWVSLDDDIECTTDTCGSMIESLDESWPRVIVVPFMTRAPDGAQRCNVEVPTIRSMREFRGARLLQLHSKRHGFAMVGMNRLAMTAIREANQELLWYDDDGRRKLALFYDHFDFGTGHWYGEDYSFFRRVPTQEVSIEALLVGTTLHAGNPLDLNKL